MRPALFMSIQRTYGRQDDFFLLGPRRPVRRDRTRTLVGEMMTRDKMIGRRCADGPGGRDCPCCGQSPGRARKKTKRAKKPSERQKWRNEVK